jgi:hypothetical protein
LPGGQSLQAEKFLRDAAPADIRQMLADFYRDNLRLDAGQPPLKTLLDNRSYTPRQQVYLAWYLAEINARNSNDAINCLSLAPTASRAAYHAAQMELLHAIHREHSPIKQFAALQNQLGALTVAGELIVAPLWDHTRERGNVARLLDEMNNFAKNYHAARQELWLVGDMDDKVAQAARARKIAARGNVAADPIFRFTALRELTYQPLAGDKLPASIATVARDAAVWQERTQRPAPAFKMALKHPANTVQIVEYKPLWNGRLAIEKKITPTPPKNDLNESGSPTGKMPSR